MATRIRFFGVAAYEIVTSLGGTIRVESKLGSGTTFVVELPKSPAAERPDADH